MSCDKEECKKLVTDKKELETKLEGVNKDLKTKGDDLTKANQELVAEKTKLENTLKEKDALAKVNETLVAEKKALETKLEGVNQDLKKKEDNLTQVNQDFKAEKERLEKINETLATEKANFETKLEEAKNILRNKEEELTKANQDFKAEKERLDKINETLATEKKNLGTKLEEVNSKNVDLNKENEKFNEDLAAIKAHNKDLTISYERTQKECDDLTQEIEVLSKENMELKSKIERLIEENEIQRREIIESHEKRGSTMIISNPREERIIEDFDFCIPIKSFSSTIVDQSWTAEVKEGYFDKHANRMKKESTRVAVFGYEGVGKDFLINLLKGPPVSQGKYSKTRGLSIIYPKENELPYTFLNTPGMNGSIKQGSLEEKIKVYFDKKGLSPEEKKRILYKDTELVETLIEDFLFEHAHVLLVVVGRVRRTDQSFLDRIKAREGKSVIIVHNFVDAETVDDINQMVKEDIEDVYNITEKRVFISSNAKSQNEYIYLENDKNRTQHVILGKEGYESGDFCNTSAINYLKSVFKVGDSSPELDLPNAFAQYLNTHITKYLLPADEVKGSDFVSWEKASDEKSYVFKFNQADKYELRLKKKKNSNETEEEIKEKFEGVPYRVKTMEDSNKKENKVLQLEFEVVGDFNEKDIKIKATKINNDEVILGVKGTVVDSQGEEEKVEIHKNTRKFGQFKIITKPINIKGYTIPTRPKVGKILPGLMGMTCVLEKIDLDDFE